MKRKTAEKYLYLYLLFIYGAVVAVAVVISETPNPIFTVLLKT